MANHSFRITLPWQIARASRPGGFPTRAKSANTILLSPASPNVQMEVYFLKEGNLEADKNTKDEALLDMTAQVLAQEHSQPQLIVLHLMGCIRRPATGHKANTKPLLQSKETSCYLIPCERKRTIYCASCTISYATAAAASLWFTFLTTVWPLKSAAKTCNTLPMMINISKISRCLFMVISSDDKAHR